MLMINPGATFIAVLVSGGIYYVMKRRSLRARWGDMRYGIMMFGAREIIHRMALDKSDDRTWKPNILVLSGVPSQRWHLVELADAISQGTSFVTIATMLPKSSWSAERAASLNETISQYLKKQNVQALVNIFPADDPLMGAQELIRTYGFGPIVPNTILIGETRKVENYVEFARLIYLTLRTQRNLVIVSEGDNGNGSGPKNDDGKRIDVWWGGQSRHIFFILALAYLLSNSSKWTGSRLMLKMIVDSEDGKEDALKKLQAFVQKERIGAEIEILVRDNRGIFDIIRDSSRDAGIVFLGLRCPEKEESPEEYSSYYQQLLADIHDMPVTALVLSAEDIDFQRIFKSGVEEEVNNQ